ncbi:MAG: hypothetical protein UT02_C0061G0013 [Parcubacteria group bacterium GW2011_GWC2_38_7]|nr:MAG: hypothetical protein UT02_C0061G0013 [Parcubacteria group bacterium GW2011_GWC2_38_7]
MGHFFIITNYCLTIQEEELEQFMQFQISVHGVSPWLMNLSW